jgi:hypothetical protein
MSLLDKESMENLARAIAEQLPKEYVIEIIGAAVKNAIDRFSWGDDKVADLVKECIVERARELVKTKYKEQIEQKADLLAAKMVSDMSRLVVRDR